MPKINESDAKNHAIKELGQKKFDDSEMVLVNTENGSVYAGGNYDSETIKELGEIICVKGEINGKDNDKQTTDES